LNEPGSSTPPSPDIYWNRGPDGVDHSIRKPTTLGGILTHCGLEMPYKPMKEPLGPCRKCYIERRESQ